MESRTVGCGVIRAEGSAPSLWLGILETVARLICGGLRMNELVSRAMGLTRGYVRDALLGNWDARGEHGR
jgi:hypothetical protein